ncbi:Glycine/D-amino acid oxidase [Collimonas sp. OK607]|uniref:NAD(P)/FAD-dependent oxidoreductase n=1 Tax=Collimonas sp. OK607 TaxID=1798194 RepID=UPI0008EC51D5|nr:FAD-binding oxidoreductase [Collimonas sp. OK607]SFB35232.1 Glycine/D-amino acid oxidase [Collimonas sp. OK607]
MTGPFTENVISDQHFPDTTDVVVIGGGIVGACTALELAERGLRVVVFDKANLNEEQSSRNLGWVRLTNRDPAEIPLMIESIRLWSEMDRRINRTTGYVRSGIIFSDKDESVAARRQLWLKQLENTEFRVRALTRAEMGAHFQGSTFPAVHSFLSPFDGRAEPQLAVPAIAAAARDRGAQIFTHCAVRHIDTAAGQLRQVITERGTVTTSAVVIAAGAWTNALCAQLGIDFPQLEVIATAFRTSAIQDGPNTSFGTGEFAFRRRWDGGYTVGSFRTRAELVPNSFRYAWKFREALRTQQVDIRLGSRFFRETRHLLRHSTDFLQRLSAGRTLDPSPWFDQQQVLKEVAMAFPFLRKGRLEQAWAGCIDVTPEQIPVISPIERIPGLFVASGFSGHGFGLAPGAGRLMADLVEGRTPVVDPTAFRFSRY